MTNNLLSQAKLEAEKVLLKCTSPLGFKASALSSGYTQVWARDSMITSLGTLTTNNPRLHTAVKKSLETLKDYQTHLGYIPNNIDTKDKQVEAKGPGSIDSNSWYIIGHDYYYQKIKDKDFLLASYSSIQQAVLWLEYQDSDNCGLIEMQEAADWEDILATRHNGLYANVLFYQALVSASKIAQICADQQGAKHYKSLAVKIKDLINQRLWLEPKTLFHLAQKQNIEAEWQFAYIQAIMKLRKRPYYLPWLAFRDYGDWCDNLGNSLAIVFGVADRAKTNLILDYMHQVGMDSPFPGKAIYSPIRPGEKDWREYYKNNNLNQPDQYHNGGIWPFVGGFYVWALVKAGRKQEAEIQLMKLIESNKKGKKYEWEFNEWLHGVTGQPMGMAYQAWSAGMLLFSVSLLEKQI